MNITHTHTRARAHTHTHRVVFFFDFFCCVRMEVFISLSEVPAMRRRFKVLREFAHSVEIRAKTKNDLWGYRGRCQQFPCPNTHTIKRQKKKRPKGLSGEVPAMWRTKLRCCASSRGVDTQMQRAGVLHFFARSM